MAWQQLRSPMAAAADSPLDTAANDRHVGKYLTITRDWQFVIAKS
jgi:hypothetical protein